MQFVVHSNNVSSFHSRFVVRCIRPILFICLHFQWFICHLKFNENDEMMGTDQTYLATAAKIDWQDMTIEAKTADRTQQQQLERKRVERERERAGKAVTRHVLSIQNKCFPSLSALLHLGVCDHMCTIFTIFMMMIINLWSWQTDRFLTITLKLCVARFHFLAEATCAPAVRQRFYMRRKMIISLLRSYRCTMSSECIDLLMSINGKVCGFWWNICLSAL